MVYQNTATLTALRFGGSAEVRARRVVEATPQRDERDRAPPMSGTDASDKGVHYFMQYTRLERDA